MAKNLQSIWWMDLLHNTWHLLHVDCLSGGLSHVEGYIQTTKYTYIVYLYTTFSTTALYIILHLSCSWSRTSFNLMLKRNQCEKEKRNQTLKTKLNKHIIWPCFESLCQCPEQLVCGKPRVCTWCIHNANRCFLSETDIFFLMYRFFKIVNVQTSQAIIYESRVNK